MTQKKSSTPIPSTKSPYLTDSMSDSPFREFCKILISTLEEINRVLLYEFI